MASLVAGLFVPSAAGRGKAELPLGCLGLRKLRDIKGTLFWGPYNKDPTILGTIMRSPIFATPHIMFSIEECCL